MLRTLQTQYIIGEHGRTISCSGHSFRVGCILQVCVNKLMKSFSCYIDPNSCRYRIDELQKTTDVYYRIRPNHEYSFSPFKGFITPGPIINTFAVSIVLSLTILYSKMPLENTAEYMPPIYK